MPQCDNFQEMMFNYFTPSCFFQIKNAKFFYFNLVHVTALATENTILPYST